MHYLRPVFNTPPPCPFCVAFHPDINGDGNIDKAEMVKYLEATFRALLAFNDEAAAAALDPADLAVKATEQCFADADVDGDETLTFDVRT